MEATETEQPSPPLRSPGGGELLSKIWDAACIYTKEFSNWTEQPPTLPGKLTPHLPMRFHQCFGSLNPDFWMRLFWQKWAKMYWHSMENFTFCDFFTFWHQNAILKARRHFGSKSSWSSSAEHPLQRGIRKNEHPTQQGIIKDPIKYLERRSG